MKITETVTETKEKIIGFNCDLCKKDFREKWHTGPGSGKGNISQSLDDDGQYYTKNVDLCVCCTIRVFDFIKDNGGRIVETDF